MSPTLALAQACRRIMKNEDTAPSGLGQVGNLPALADLLARRQVLAEHFPEPLPAPDPLLEHRHRLQRIDVHSVILPEACGVSQRRKGRQVENARQGSPGVGDPRSGLRNADLNLACPPTSTIGAVLASMILPIHTFCILFTLSILTFSQECGSDTRQHTRRMEQTTGGLMGRWIPILTSQ